MTRWLAMAALLLAQGCASSHPMLPASAWGSRPAPQPVLTPPVRGAAGAEYRMQRDVARIQHDVRQMWLRDCCSVEGKAFRRP